MTHSLQFCRYACMMLFALLLGGYSTTAFAQSTIELSKIGGYETGIFDEGAAEISAYDARSKRLFVTNSDEDTIDILDLSYPSNPTFIASIDISSFGEGINSVAVDNGLVAAAIEGDDQEPGYIAFFDIYGNFIVKYEVGALPDMVTFTPNGRFVLAAIEGEPSDEYDVDPEGQIAIIRRVSPNQTPEQLARNRARILDFKAFNDAELDESVRIFGPGATVAQDLEPEYIAVSDYSDMAYVTLQENNAVAVVNVRRAQIEAVVGLGFKDHSAYGNALDASNRDDAINIQNWPVYGMYQPDAIAYYTAHDGEGYLVTANEGDARDYDGFSEEERIGDLDLDPDAFPNAETLQEDENLGRLNSTTANGDIDGDGYFEKLFAYGARSFSIWNTSGELVFDSGDQFEQITASLIPDDFNSTNDENDSFDNRSDDKGPEPEGVVVGKVNGQTYAFIGLERVGGVMVYNVTYPESPYFVQYINSRDFTGDAEEGTAGDLAPEGLVFIPADESPNGYPLLVVSYEVSGSVAVFQIDSVPYSPASGAQQDEALAIQKGDTEQPFTFDLMQNYPNPFNPTTTIQYSVQEDVHVRLSIYNVLGQEVRSLVNATQAAGQKSVQWNGRNEAGQLVPSGMYYYRIDAGSFTMVRSMLLAK